MDVFSTGYETSEYAFAVSDQNDLLALALRHSGQLVLGGGAELGAQSDWDFAIIDGADNVGFGIKGGVLFFPASASSGFDARDLNSKDKTFSAAIEAQNIDGVQQPTATYNIIVNWGQSLAAGQQAFPSLSKTPEPGALMLGDNVDNINGSDSYGVIGALRLNPLVAHTHDGTSNLDAAGEAALLPGDPNIGEPPVIGLTNGLKRALNRRALAENDGRNLVAISPAISGKTIEQLSKGALNTQDNTDRYAILQDGIAEVVALAEPESVTVPLVTWMQGEYNYEDHGGSSDRATYATLENAMFDNIAADMKAATGQQHGPLFLTYQTGASYTRDADSNGTPGLHVGMAQLDVALARPDTAMAGPVYPYTDRNGHLEPNGSRWFGHQMAKVARRILLDGKAWQPLRPIHIEAVGTEIYIGFHVPVAPLVFDTPYVKTTATDYATKGFRVTTADGLNDYTINAVEIIADTVVKLSLTDTPDANALVWYADKSVHNGNGNLRDSDPSLAIDSFEYVPDRGAYETDNIPELVGKPYALHNWSVAFCLPLTYSEF